MNTLRLSTSWMYRGLLCLSLMLGSAATFAEEVPYLQGKPSSEEILRALGAGEQPKQYRMRGLSLGGAQSVTTAPAAAQPQAVAEKGIRALDLAIQFGFDSSNLLPDGRDVLQELGKALRSDSLGNIRTIVLEGHTDAVGSAAYNTILSLKRARSAKAYLISQGIAADKLQVVGKGFTELARPDQPTSRENRRVRIIVMN